MTKRVLIALLALLCCASIQAQHSDSTGFHASVSTGTAFMSGFGQQQSIQWIAPSFELHSGSRLTVRSGFAVAGSFLTPDERKVQYTPNLAPRRPNTDIRSIWGTANYQLTDRLSVWAGLWHTEGSFLPLWGGDILPLRTTVFSGGFEYEMWDNSYLQMYFSIAHDAYGTALPALMSTHGLGLGMPSMTPFDHHFPF